MTLRKLGRYEIERLGRGGTASVAGVLESVLGGLAEAATRRIVHRDLKPENVLVPPTVSRRSPTSGSRTRSAR